jgi:NADH:ubiquinone oxidoreductase subunit 5 (subunit L)/multisubunit Na+/H+ antiporter MnhA subunit
LGVIILFIYTKSVDFKVIFSLLPFFENQTFFFLNYSVSPLTLASIFLAIGAIGKSAQLGLHT